MTHSLLQVFVLGLRAIQELADKDAAHDAELAAVKAEYAALKTKQAEGTAELAAVRMELTKQDQKQVAQDELLAALSREVAALRAA